MKYVTIGRVELYFCSRPYSLGRLKSCCGCFIFELGPIGFTWLSEECKRPLDETPKS